MKKVLLLCFILVLSVEGFSQVKFGLKFSPGLALNRVKSDLPDSSGIDVERNGAGIRFIAGPEINIEMSDNVSFVTGIWYTSRRAGVKVQTATATYKEVYSLQYVQLPAYLKLYTNEIATDMKVYFNLGGTFDVNIAEKLKKSNAPVLYGQTVRDFRRFDATVLVGAGVQLQMGENTYLLAGLSYNRGLVNAAWRTHVYTDVNGRETKFIKSLNTDLLAIDLGLRF